MTDEMRDRFNIDIKPEEIQCKVNQTRAKFRQVKKHLDSDKNAIKWKKYDIIENFKNQYRSKDDEPVPLEALENNRDVSPTELHNVITQPSSPSSTSNMSNMPEQNINLNQTISADHQLADEVNMNNASLSDQNLLSNSLQSGNSFSTELFGSDQLEIKQEIENDIKLEGFTELATLPNEQNNADGVATTAMANNVQNEQQQQQSIENQSNFNQRLTQQQMLPQQHLAHTENETNALAPAVHNTNPNALLLQNRVVNNHNNINATTDGIMCLNNHVNTNNNAMQPPPKPVTMHTPRKRNRTSVAATAAAAATLCQ
ncbi:hypothetical protein EVAR_67272_1 [Eumeta japonica]|uniref:MADF domain-containing protein n=1 Tax=Eumeta variegata TaxID=151549 RepID=A0A4C1SE73_EUMVA|nr:hypothetical protein EVAR_67272_1 [Eumeta japonica]